MHSASHISPTFFSVVTRKLQTAAWSNILTWLCRKKSLYYCSEVKRYRKGKESDLLNVSLCKLFGWPTCREGFLNFHFILRAYYGVELSSIQKQEDFFFPWCFLFFCPRSSLSSPLGNQSQHWKINLAVSIFIVFAGLCLWRGSSSVTDLLLSLMIVFLTRTLLTTAPTHVT